jgi:transketolase
MRTALVETLLELAAADDRIFLVTGDLGWNVVEKFATAHPDRYLNAGVAEANMAGIATGLAQAGFVPFIYSIATFTSMRCYEQVRNGPVLHRLPVRVVGIAAATPTATRVPLITRSRPAIARTQPGLTVLVPADPAQTRTIVRATMDLPGPAYLRVGKGGNAEVPGLGGRFALGRPEVVRDGSDVLFLTCGSVVHEALAAARDLDADKVSAAVAVLAHLPFTASDALSTLIRRFTSVVTVEEGYVAGGLGSLVAEAIVEQGLGTRLERRGVRESPTGASERGLHAPAVRSRCHPLAAAARHRPPRG